MKQGKLLVAALLFCGLTMAQTARLTMEDAMVKNRTTLAPATLRQLQFIYGTDDYVYVGKQNDEDCWMKGNFAAKAELPFLTLAQLNEKLRSAAVDTLTRMPMIQFNQGLEWILYTGTSKIALNPKTGQVRSLIGKEEFDKENVEESSNGYVAYLDNYNLFVSKDGARQQVTTDGSKDIVYASSVHRDEFGITKGIFWSNNGNLLAFYRMDQSMVTDYPIIDWTQRPAKAVEIKYPMAGDASHHVTLGVYNTTTRKVTWINTGLPAEQYLTNIAWSPDDRFVYIAVLNRGQDHMKLNQYDAASGAFVKTLFEETDPKYVEPLVPMLFVKNNPALFVWQSNRDGWNHLYLYDTSGAMIRQLTSGPWEVTEVKGFDGKGQNLYYTSTAVSPLSRNLYSVAIKTATSKALTTGDQVHSGQVSNSGRYILDSYSDVNDPRTIRLIDARIGKSKNIFQAPNPIAGFATGSVSIFPITGTDNTTLYCRLFKPVNFDSTKQYPLIVYWYGGSHVQLIQNAWNGGAGDYWFQYMAERGYLVFSLDTRGSDNRGKAFEQAMFRHVGDPQMEDMLTAVNYLKSKPWVDAGRMGLFGWSFGGFNTVDFMVNHPGIFKVAVAGGPVIDWRYYEIMYTERYMDTPQENPDGYDATDLTKKVGNLKGKLMLIHGLQDNVVVQQHSVRFVRAAIDKNIQVDYMIYPGHEHNVIGKDRAHLYQKVTDYFTEYLSPAKGF